MVNNFHSSESLLLVSLAFLQCIYSHTILDRGNLGLLLAIPIVQWTRYEGATEHSQLVQFIVPRGIYYVNEGLIAVTFFGPGPVG